MRAYTHTFIVLLILLFAQNIQAQKSNRTVKKMVTTSVVASEKVANDYIDSLKAYRKKIDSLMLANDSLRKANGYAADNKYYRFFAPTTFYPEVTANAISQKNPTDTAETKALMNLYMKRPDLVAYSASKLAKESGENGEISQEQAPEKLELAKQVVAAPIVTDEAQIKNDTIALFVKKPNFWKFNGDYYLQFMQNYVTPNWYKSGSNTYSMLGAVTLQYNYNNKQKVKWENKLEMKLGFMTSESDTVNKFKSSEDLLRLTSKLGLQAHKHWYYTAQLVANTQFTKGLKDNKTKVFSDFMSPFNLNVSLGMDYEVNVFKGKLKGNVHIAPLAYNLKYVDRLDLAKSFGLEEDHHTLSDYGSQVTIDMVWTPWDFLKWQMRMYAYTTYSKFEFECENTIGFKFNKYISANLFLYPRFDDGAKPMEGYSFWQFKEYLSLGFSYSM